MQSAHPAWARVAGITVAATAIALVSAGAGLAGQHGPRGRGHMMGGGQMADMPLIHELLDSGDRIHRTVTVRADGVETLTESDDPALAKKIREHVVSMYGRVGDGRPIHMRDPLFREIFANASKIEMKHQPTEKGVRVVETSADPYVVKLIQAHAEVVSLFIRNGRAEAMKDHDVPAR